MTIDRRTLLGSIAAGGLAAALPAAARARTAADQPLRVVLYDSRYPQSVAFAQSQASPTVLLVDTRSRDIGVAWYGEIKDHLTRHPGRIEGLSLYSDQYISQALAKPLGYKDVTVTKLEGRPTLFRWSIA